MRSTPSLALNATHSRSSVDTVPSAARHGDRCTRPSSARAMAGHATST
ncbi:hypothetical protein ACFPRL_27880 [Pseudoclavibacter helvolus]